MSSRVRVLLPDDSREATPFIWPQAGPAKDTVKAVAAEPQPDFGLRAAKMQREGEQRVREAHAAGMREGEAAGRGRAAAELQPALERLAASINEIANLRARLRGEAEADLVKLSLAI